MGRISAKVIIRMEKSTTIECGAPHKDPNPSTVIIELT